MLRGELGVLAGFTVLALVLGLKKPVWLALLLASMTMGLIGSGFDGFTTTLISTAHSTATFDLVLVVFMIAILVNLYNATGFISMLGEELVKLLGKPKLVASVVPAVMGLLPVPGGALMSAPVVDAVGDKLGLSREKKLFINVWFRHVVFIVYPLSAVIVTTASLTGISVWSLVARGLPVAFSMVVAGYLLGFRNTGQWSVGENVEGDVKEVLRVLSPMLTAVVVALVLSPLVDRQLVPWVPLTRYSMIIGLTLALILLVKLSGASLRLIWEATRSRITVELVLASFSAVLLRDVFMAIDGPRIFSEIAPLSSELWKTVFMVLAPFTVSLATGSPLVGVVLATSMFRNTASLGVREVALIYASNMLGYIASPAHLCYVYTAQYFKTPLANAYKEMSTATIVALTAALIQFFII
ncbi:MAG: DUF401 family protein [Nanopusillaceae archaeon]